MNVNDTCKIKRKNTVAIILDSNVFIPEDNEDVKSAQINLEKAASPHTNRCSRPHLILRLVSRLSAFGLRQQEAQLVLR